MKERIIELSFNNHQEALTLPVNPAEFEFSGAQDNQKVTLLNIGEVNLLGHRGLVSGSLSSFFPSAKSPFYKLASMEPAGYIALLEKWKDSQRPIRVIISDCDFNLAMSIDSFSHKHREGDGDVYYTLSLTEYRFLTIPTVQTAISVKKSNGLNDRASGSTSTAKTHTVVSGDALWGIAKKYYGNGSQYTKIYAANKSVIKNPNLIYPGQVLTIP